MVPVPDWAPLQAGAAGDRAGEHRVMGLDRLGQALAVGDLAGQTEVQDWTVLNPAAWTGAAWAAGAPATATRGEGGGRGGGAGEAGDVDHGGFLHTCEDRSLRDLSAGVPAWVNNAVQRHPAPRVRTPQLAEVVCAPPFGSRAYLARGRGVQIAYERARVGSRAEPDAEVTPGRAQRVPGRLRRLAGARRAADPRAAPAAAGAGDADRTAARRRTAGGLRRASAGRRHGPAAAGRLGTGVPVQRAQPRARRLC